MFEEQVRFGLARGQGSRLRTVLDGVDERLGHRRRASATQHGRDGRRPTPSLARSSRARLGQGRVDFRPLRRRHALEL